jgi:hypothetical protein
MPDLPPMMRTVEWVGPDAAATLNPFIQRG